MRADVIHGDCLDVMRGMPDASVDAVVTDPPYGLAFMGKEWDHGVPGADFWREALRIAKPGAALLAFGGTRTFHRLACAIEDSGWRIYDCLSWMYGQGFPKHRTHLKPAWEPIVFASKKGARFVNVEGCRLSGGMNDTPESWAKKGAGGRGSALIGQISDGMREAYRNGSIPLPSGRWPANVVLDEEAARAVDEMSGESAAKPGRTGTKGGNGGALGAFAGSTASAVGTWPADPGGGASRFFYTAKASRADREDGLEGAEQRRVKLPGKSEGYNPATGEWSGSSDFQLRGNHHPTVKPTDLMRWLCRLVTPPGGTVLDPFCGSGSTGVAANAEGFDFIGIEREAQYVEIARRRIANVAPLFAEGGGPNAA